MTAIKRVRHTAELMPVFGVPFFNAVKNIFAQQPQVGRVATHSLTWANIVSIEVNAVHAELRYRNVEFGHPETSDPQFRQVTLTGFDVDYDQVLASLDLLVSGAPSLEQLGWHKLPDKTYIIERDCLDLSEVTLSVVV